MSTGCNVPASKMTYIYVISFFYTLICVNFNTVRSDEILGCGGFVKSHIPIEFSKVEIGLYTKQGSLKDMTDCAPNNGYYFLPLYDHGDYVLKVSAPDGWNFEPTEVALTVDGKTDACSLSKDINFVFVGFAVSGKVVSDGNTEGPAGVTVSLLTDINKEPLLKVTTGPGGSYAFPRVAPGKYILQVSHPNWVMSQEKANLVVSTDSHQVLGTLSVAGYPVSGLVTSDKDPIAGVSFMLHAESGKKVNKPPGCLATSEGLCRAESGADGRFVFPALAPGQYRLVPHYAAGKEGSSFDVRPRELTFTVKHEALQLSPEFEVKGFTVTGRVLAAVGGAGIPDAKVLLNGVQRALSGHNGAFRVENMKAGAYVLTAQAEQMQFESKSVKVTPGAPVLPDIVISSLAVCGEVSLGSLPSGVSSGPRTITAERLPEKTQKISATIAQGSGHYCLMLPPGDYQLYVFASEAEIRRGLKFSPPAQRLTVKDKPIQGINFSPLRATLTGKVVCLPMGGQCESLAVTVSALDSELPSVTEPVAADGSYTFSNVLPGQYEVKVKSLRSESLCWENEARRFVVSAAKSKAPELVQTGYSMALQATHATHVDYFNLENEKIGSVAAPKGGSTWCVPGPGPYMLVPESCHEFTSPWYSWEMKTGTVNLIAVKHLIGGVVLSPDQYGDITVSVTKDDGSTVNLGPLTAKQVPQGGYEYRFDMVAKPGEQLTLLPKADKLLFSPPSASVTTGLDCQPDAATFRGDRGHFVEGKVNPPLEGVEVSINQGGELVTIINTDKQGQYRAGPLPTPAPGKEYEVSAILEGYQVTRVSGGFTAKKLAEVIVRVKDSETGAPLPGVLLSLSGGEYRRNSQAGGDGSLTFKSLGPGDYFLRPKLKEYRFEPQSKLITVGEGATVNVDVSGRRVAFSCIGSVVSLSGEAETGVALEAVGTGNDCKDQQEEAISEATGQFRIRGLLPNCDYVIRLKEGTEGNKHIARISPNNLKVKAEKGDVSGVRVVAMRPPQNCDVSVLVITAKPGPLLRLRLFREDQPDSPMLERKLEPPTMPQHYLFLPSILNDGKSYYVQVDNAPGSQQRGEIVNKIAHFSANSSFRNIRIEIGVASVSGSGQGSSSDTSEEEGGERGGSLLLLPVLGVLTLATLYRAKLAPLGAQLSGALKAALASNPSPPAPTNPTPSPLDEDLIVEPVTKRKTKPRKA